MTEQQKVIRELDKAVHNLESFRDEIALRYKEIDLLRKIDSYILNHNKAERDQKALGITNLFQFTIKSLNKLLRKNGSCAFYVNLDDRFELVAGPKTKIFRKRIECDVSAIDWRAIENDPISAPIDSGKFHSEFPGADLVYVEPLFIFDSILLGVFVVQAKGLLEGNSRNWLSSKERRDTLLGVFRQLKIAYMSIVEHSRAASLNDLWTEFASKDFSPYICFNLLPKHLIEMAPRFGPMKFIRTPEVQILFRYDDSLRILATTGQERNTESVLISESISGIALLESRVLNIDPSSAKYRAKYKKYLIPGKSIRSELVIPMLSNGVAIGVVNFESDIRAAFSTVQARTLEEIVRKITPVAQSLKARLDHNREAQSAYGAIMTGYLTRFSRVLRHEVSSPTSALSSNIPNIKLRLERHNFEALDVTEEIENAWKNYKAIDRSVFSFIDDLSRYGHIGPISIVSLVAEAVEMINDTDRYSLLDGKGDRAEFTIQTQCEDDYKVKGSRLLKPYLVCLLDNSIRSIRRKRSSGQMQGEGVIIVSIFRDKVHPKNIELTIFDDGEGVTAEELEGLKRFRIGTRFRNDDGLGYGLAATQRYLTQVDGWIELDSKKDSFFSVKISLKSES